MEVKVYSTPKCPWCAKVREYLNERNIKFTEVNVAGDSEAAKEMIKKSGQMGVPVTDVDGRAIVGFDREALDKALGL